jgi:hypothetical protein
MKKYLLFASAFAVTSLVIFNRFSRRNRIVRQAKFYEDIEEVGTNKSFADATFEQMLKEVGWKSGDAWCMYFVLAVYKKVLPNKAEEIKQLSGSTQSAFNKAQLKMVPNFIAITSGRPKRGDIAIWQDTGNRAFGHAGIVIKTTSKKFPQGFTTIEGNTSANSQFYGSGQSVRIVEHNLDYGQKSQVYSDKVLRGFIRYAPLQ